MRKKYSKITAKRMLATFVALLCLAAMMPMKAQTVNRISSVSSITTSENIMSTSTVYLGEVIVGGETKIKYIYSADVSRSEAVIANLTECLKGMADGDYAALLEGQEADAEAKGLVLCTVPAIATTADGNWSSATYVGAEYYPDKAVASESSSNLYDDDEGFKAAVDALAVTRKADIETPVDDAKSIVTHLDSRTVTNVYYTFEDGQLFCHYDTNVVYDSESTTVIYTKVELGPGAALAGDANGDGKVDVADIVEIVNYLNKHPSARFNEKNADANGVGGVTTDDINAVVGIIMGK